MHLSDMNTERVWHHDFINGIAKAWTEDDKLVYFDKSGNIIWVWD
jgi:hypothetical protein